MRLIEIASTDKLMTCVINRVKNTGVKAVRRNASAAVIGAGDYIGAAIARKFADEGFMVFAGRRNGASSRRWSPMSNPAAAG